MNDEPRRILIGVFDGGESKGVHVWVSRRMLEEAARPFAPTWRNTDRVTPC